MKYRWRTRLRGVLPRCLLWLAPKGKDCGSHEFYRDVGNIWRCYHCEAGVRQWPPMSAPNTEGNADA